MLPNDGCLSEWHDAGREETVLQALRADQIVRSQLARSYGGTPYSAPARIYARTYEKKASSSPFSLSPLPSSLMSVRVCAACDERVLKFNAFFPVII